MTRSLIILAALFIPHFAYSDYVPGRTRASAQADMSAQSGTEIYKEIESGQVVLYSTDGQGYTKLTLKLDDNSEISFSIKGISSLPCGQVFEATSTKDGRFSTLRIQESNPDLCRGIAELTWSTELSTSKGGDRSHLVLTGKPEYFLLSE